MKLTHEITMRRVIKEGKENQEDRESEKSREMVIGLSLAVVCTYVPATQKADAGESIFSARAQGQLRQDSGFL